MKKLLLLYIFFLLLSCQEKKNVPQQPQILDEEWNTSLDIVEETKVNLLPEAESELRRWTAYINTKTAVEELKNYNLKEISANTEPLVEFLFELQNTIPSNYQVPPIEARINVIYTKSLVLNQLLNAQKINVEEIEEVANDLVSEFEYLKIQLNELFMESPSDFEIDLEEIEAKEDSLRQQTEKTEEPKLLQAPLLETIQSN